ncbi:Nucleolar protein 12 [Linum grandiflorum]
MGKKKASEATTVESPPSDIFKTLFSGGTDDGAVVSSLFSDANPFKRKPEAEKPPAPEVGNLEVVSNVKEKKKKEKKGDKEEEKTKEDVNEQTAKKRKREDLERDYEMKRYGTTMEVQETAVRVGGKRKKPDADDGEALISKKEEEEEGFDDENKLSRTVFVGNLPLKVKKKALLKEFSQFGEVESVRIRSVPVMDTKIPRKGAILQNKINDAAGSVHAYIVYKTAESAEASLSHNMAVVAGNHVRVDRACPPRKKLKADDTSLYDNKRTIFIGNLPFDVKDEEMYQLFTSIKGLNSSIEAVRVVRDPNNGMGKGIAYVLFKDKARESVKITLQKRGLKIRDREIRLSPARQDTSALSKRASPFRGDRGELSSGKKRRIAPENNSNGHRDAKPSMAYEGWRAKKSGVEKKPSFQLQVTSKAKFKKQKEQKREGKRPAVAARKAKALKELSGDYSSPTKATGQKRKLGTPDSSNWKKAKKQSVKLG